MPARTSFGRYTLGRTLGRGATSTVIEALDERTGARVALRFPLQELESSPERWLAISSAIDCPHVVRWSGIERDGYRWAFVCELVRGIELDRLRVTTASTAWRRGLAVVSLHDVAVALTAMHEATLDGATLGLVHGDLSPGNVVLRDDGACVLMDLGETRRTALSQYTGHSVVGTPGYIAPELIRGASPDARSDLFSLGALAYAAWMGRDAFGGLDEQAVLEATLSTKPELPADDPLGALVAQCLQKRPERRPDSARRVAEQVASMIRDASMDVLGLRRSTALAARALAPD